MPCFSNVAIAVKNVPADIIDKAKEIAIGKTHGSFFIEKGWILHLNGKNNDAPPEELEIYTEDDFEGAYLKHVEVFEGHTPRTSGKTKYNYFYYSGDDRHIGTITNLEGAKNFDEITIDSSYGYGVKDTFWPNKTLKPEELEQD